MVCRKMYTKIQPNSKLVSVAQMLITKSKYMIMALCKKIYNCHRLIQKEFFCHVKLFPSFSLITYLRCFFFFIKMCRISIICSA